MNRIGNVAWAGIFTVLAMGFISSARGQGQSKGQPGVVQTGTFQAGIHQTPWFSNPAIRQHLKFNDDHHNGLNKAYQQSWTRYNQGVNELDKKLTDDQRQQRMRDLEQGFHKDFSNTTEKIITDPQQRQRYNQLYWQYRGYGAFEDPMVAQKLKLTPDQREKLGQYRRDWSKQIDELGPIYQVHQGEGTRRYTQMQSETGGRLNSVLTPEQQKNWRQMIGDPYTFQPNVYFQPSVAPPGKK